MVNTSNPTHSSSGDAVELQDIDINNNSNDNIHSENIQNSQSSDVINEDEQESGEANVDDNDNNNEQTTGNHDTLADRLLPENFRNIATRQMDDIGRRFNILDRVYRRSNDTGSSNGAIGTGTILDGVFSNLTAKPDNNNNNQGDEAQNDRPPTYDEAAADLVPSYYGLDLANSEMYDELCIEGVPVGNMANLIWNIIVSTSFQFIGFLITYMLHTSHAAKQGSRFGLGLTFLSYGYSMIPNNVVSKVGKHKNINRIEPVDPNNYDDLRINAKQSPQDEFESQLSHGVEEEKQSVPFLAIAIGLLGLFISLKSIIDFIAIKRRERRYLAQNDNSAV